MEIYLGQLPFNVKEDEIRELFSAFGEITDMNLIKDRFSGRFKGFGFLTMPNNSEADTAIKALNKSMFKGQEIKVNQVQKQKKTKKRFRR